MSELQYLVECSDSSLCLIYQRSILIQKNLKHLSKGCEIEFLWPKNPKGKKKQIKYLGKILEISDDETILLLKMEKLIKKAEEKPKKNKGSKRMKSGAIKEKSSNNEMKNIEMRLKTRVNSLIDEKIIKKLENQISPTKSLFSSEMQPSTSGAASRHINKENEMQWLTDEVNILTSHINSCSDSLLSIQKNLGAVNEKLNYIKDIADDGNTNIIKSGVRRSYNMPLSDEDEEEHANNSQIGSPIFDYNRRSYVFPTSNEDAENKVLREKIFEENRYIKNEDKWSVPSSPLLFTPNGSPILQSKKSSPLPFTPNTSPVQQSNESSLLLFTPEPSPVLSSKKIKKPFLVIDLDEEEIKKEVVEENEEKNLIREKKV